MDDLSNVDEEEQEEVLNEAYLYITEGRYPDGCGADKEDDPQESEEVHCQRQWRALLQEEKG